MKPIPTLLLAGLTPALGCASTNAPRPGAATPVTATAPAGEQRISWITPAGTLLRYAISVPAIPSGARVPLIVALHGRPNSQTVPPFYGARTMEALVAPALEPLGAVIVAPDAPRNNWTDPAAERAVLDLVADVLDRYPVDPQRTLLMGFSMGGVGTWYLARRHPRAFRAALPMASFPLIRPTPINRSGLTAAWAEMDADTAGSWTLPFREVPVYAIHSREDDSVPFASDSALVSRILSRGGQVEFVALDGLKHGPVSDYRPALAAAIPWILRQWARP